MSFPVSLTDFANRLLVTDMSLHLPDAVEESQTAAGEVIRAQLGVPLWQGRIALWQMRGGCARQFRAILDLLQRPGASFLLRPRDIEGPIADPDGAIISGSTVTLTSVAANNRDITLGGLPTGYVLQRGDFLSFTYASSPQRYAFHQVVSPEAAAVSGALTVEVNAPVRAGWAAGATVRLFRPQFKAVMRQRNPGSTQMLGLGPNAKPIHGGMEFDFIQTLR